MFFFIDNPPIRAIRRTANTCANQVYKKPRGTYTFKTLRAQYKILVTNDDVVPETVSIDRITYAPMKSLTMPNLSNSQYCAMSKTLQKSLDNNPWCNTKYDVDHIVRHIGKNKRKVRLKMVRLWPREQYQLDQKSHTCLVHHVLYVKVKQDVVHKMQPNYSNNKHDIFTEEYKCEKLHN